MGEGRQAQRRGMRARQTSAGLVTPNPDQVIITGLDPMVEQGRKLRRSLGRGLSQLLGESAPSVYAAAAVHESNPSEISLASIVANPKQPRKRFDEDSLNELAESIKQYGVLQPIVVRPIGE